MIGLLYMANSNGCRHKTFIPAEVKAPTRVGTPGLVRTSQHAGWQQNKPCKHDTQKTRVFSWTDHHFDVMRLLARQKF